jgi:hypothetical protein
VLFRSLRRTYGISEPVIQQIWEDLLTYHQQTPEEYIRHRHLELQDQGLKNDQIYRLLRKELNQRLFPGPELSIRQVRRIIYG